MVKSRTMFFCMLYLPVLLDLVLNLTKSVGCFDIFNIIKKNVGHTSF